MTESDVIPGMSCNQAQEDAVAFLGGELSLDEERRVMAHLTNCESCRKEFRRDRLVMRMLTACPAATAGPDFDELLAKRIANEKPAKPVLAEEAPQTAEGQHHPVTKHHHSHRIHRKPT